MTRLMSVAYTEQQVRDRVKDVTRRLNWWEDRRGRRLLRPGDRLTLVRKVMGRKAGEPIVHVDDVVVLDVRREPLSWLTDPDRPALDPVTGRWSTYGRVEVAREGFPGMDPAEFVDRYFVRAQGIPVDAVVTRIQWRYLEPTDEQLALYVDHPAVAG
ncbi:hypothetical protein [Nocardioides sp. LML1-1-1.1]|uniref:hypothetical protein n=1 Tax=Nocardioides sp. LML1-1-1.1 TaxID=3135248 RepID=UPI0034437EB5